MLFVFFSAAFAQDLPKIAVYVTGDIPDNNKRVFGPQLLASLVNSGRYNGIERPSVFFAEAEQKRTTEYGGVINDSQLSELGKEFGVDYIGIADVVPAFGLFQIEIRIIDVETAKTVFAGESNSSLKTSDELTLVLETIVGDMFGEQIAHVSESEPESEQEPESESAPVAYAPELSAVDRASAVAVAPTSVPSSAPVAAAPAPVAVETKWPPKAAVYITGLNPLLGNALSKAVSSALMKAKIYEGIESIDQHITGTPTDKQIIEAGKKASVDFVFVINVSGKINVRILDVDLATELANISLDGKLNTPLDAGKVAASIVNFILKEGPKPPPGYQAPAQTTVAAGGETAKSSNVVGKGDGEKTRGYYVGVNRTLAGSRGTAAEWASLEGGWVWENRVFFGMEMGGGQIANKDSEEFSYGYGFNVGHSYELLENLSFVYGLSVGAWMMGDFYFDFGMGNFYYYDDDPDSQLFIGFGGPFVKLRFGNGIELTYRGLMGIGGALNEDEPGFRYKSQLKLGFRNEGVGRDGKYYGVNRTLAGSRLTTTEWIAIETGYLWGDRGFYGFEFGMGVSGHPDSSKGGKIYVCSGANIGNSYKLFDRLNLVYGMSAGIWSMNHLNWYQWYWGEQDVSRGFLGFGGPFVKLRYGNGIELTYRGLIGINTKIDEKFDYWGYETITRSHDFGYKSQLKLGYRYEHVKRER